MRNDLFIKEIKSRTLFIVGSACVVGFLLLFPFRALLADHYYGGVTDLLDDKNTEGRDIVELSEASLPAYETAVSSLELAARLNPPKALYHKALSEIYTRLGLWSEAMAAMNVPLPAGARSSPDVYGAASAQLGEASSRQPAKADYHLALSRIQQARHNFPGGNRELELAAGLYPGNAEMRFNVAMQYLLAGQRDEALRHAKVLAALDDSYVTFESPQKKLVLERRPASYIAMLSRSYLFKALEIAWRASDKDLTTLRTMLPDNDEAREVLKLFLEAKGIGE